MSEEGITEKQKQFIRELKEKRQSADDVIKNYGDINGLTKETASKLIGELMFLPEKKQKEKIGEVECNGDKYTVSRISQGKYLIEGGTQPYRIIPSELKCECSGRTYNGRCKHLYHPNFIELWRYLGEMKKAKEEEKLAHIIDGIITEDKAANIFQQVLGDVDKKSVITNVPQVGEMLKADAVIALANALGIKRENLENTPNIETIEGENGEEMVVVRSKIRASYTHPSGVILQSEATVLQKLNMNNLKGGRGTDLTFRAVQSKAERKAILRVLPITHSGLLSKIKKIYGWS